MSDEMPAMEAMPEDHTFDGWEELSWEERRERRIAKWMAAPGVEFVDETVRAAYVERIQMVIDAVTLKKPVRVPVVPQTGFYTARYAGLSAKDAMYDYDKLAAAWVKFYEDMRPDFQSTDTYPGPVYDILGAKMIDWPGHGVDDDSPWQYLEKEYMQAGDYDELIADPSAFFRRKLLPQYADAFAGLGALDPFSDTMEAASLPFTILGFADPAVVESVQRLHEAANATLEYMGALMGCSGETTARLGLPTLWGPTIKAPYDCIADTLRGTKGIVMDRYRQPAKIIEAAERFVPLQIDMAVRFSLFMESPLVCIPLHKGADGYMSDADFRTFYWPTLKAVLQGIIDQGLVPWVFAEGGYNERLDAIVDHDLPAGAIMWWFDQTDMIAAKRALGGYAAIGGNVPSAMLALGDSAQVEAYVTKLLDDVAVDGGFVLGPGGMVDDAKPETMKAMIDTARRWAG